MEKLKVIFVNDFNINIFDKYFYNTLLNLIVSLQEQSSQKVV